ncbi:cell envelope integrity protein TolA [Emcibacter sp. SYSU 3D8]|uniref:cell envelope integrity protein TolA n=1 Tax=Emcibacter sp. SYSU 3D8 TaxID=3133969 RepID=UPI0031FE9E16
MRKPLIFSGLFHVLILAMALVSWNWFGEPEIIDDNVPVVMVPPEALITPDAIPTPTPKDEPKPQKPDEKPPAEKAPEPEPDQASPTPPRVDEAAETPPPEPAPTPEPTPEPPKPDRVTKDLPNVTPRDKPKPPKKFDMAAIEKLLLDKRDTTTPQTKDNKPKKPTDPDPSQAKDPSRNPMEQARATANIQSAIASQIARCWAAPVGATGAETLVVRIRIYLRRDGSLANDPVIVDRGRMMSDNLYKVAAEAAKRAVQRCAPLKLPADYYDIWRDVILNFDPKML